MTNTKHNANLRIKRKKRIRKKVNGTGERPRLTVYRSAKHLYAQVIDDIAGKTVASVHSFKGGRANTEECAKLGKSLADLCKEKHFQSGI